ncbi:uncharacterized protein LOC105837286 isoform X5 [Monomorium pharaonis]|uniref:uncharacterized protein LOC105837286 isoform X5 n=1 Tax=Monomorium pharaonis TaxID=307658 RepID=UPI0017465AF5|nr:uncharacterized protein LOC105837286 isoform X5 [Monomorium pharaonis]
MSERPEPIFHNDPRLVVKMGTCWFAVWVLFVCFIGDARPQYRDKNISTAETDAVQALLARYLQRRLQGSQLSTPPPPSVLFSNDHRTRVRQATQRGPSSNSLVSRNVTDNDGDQRPVPGDYDDYEDDLEGYEDSERSRTRFDLLAGKSRLTLITATGRGRLIVLYEIL